MTRFLLLALLGFGLMGCRDSDKTFCWNQREYTVTIWIMTNVPWGFSDRIGEDGKPTPCKEIAK